MADHLNAVKQLKLLLDANYNARLADFQKTLRREQSIKNSLGNLRDTSRLARSKPVVEMQSIGADVTWHSWLDKQARILNMELAQVLVQKEQEMQILKKEFGKKFASDEITRTARHNSRKHSLKVREGLLNEIILQEMALRNNCK